MSAKLNWSCATCGMSSSRKWSVKRHILNLHNGSANCIRFTEYLSGRSIGRYNLQAQSTKTTGLMDMLLTEAHKDFARKVATFVNPPGDDPGYKDMARMVRQHSTYKNFRELMHDRWT